MLTLVLTLALAGVRAADCAQVAARVWWRADRRGRCTQKTECLKSDKRSQAGSQGVSPAATADAAATTGGVPREGWGTKTEAADDDDEDGTSVAEVRLTVRRPRVTPRTTRGEEEEEEAATNSGGANGLVT